MPVHLDPINPTRALFIKLGRAGGWEKECIKHNIIKFGYTETPFDAAVLGDWETVFHVWQEQRKGDVGAAKRDLSQIKCFFDDGPDTLWVTFFDGKLWWCFAKSGVKRDNKDISYRECVDKWRSTDINGVELTQEKLSGKLLRVQGFRGTICEIKAFEYLKNKLNGTSAPQVEEAFQAKSQMIEKLGSLISLLTWQDFELLVDLVFTNSGWRRVNSVGGTQKMVDIELILPVTKERAFVQVKSSTSKQQLHEYQESLQNSDSYSRMFYVWHTGDLNEVPKKDNVTLIGREKLSEMVFDAGLSTWLLEKVS